MAVLTTLSGKTQLEYHEERECGISTLFSFERGVVMHNLVKDVFVLVGTLMASLLIFYLAFGEPGRQVMWTNIEPVFQDEWNNATFNNGNTTSAIINDVFDDAEDISY